MPVRELLGSHREDLIAINASALLNSSFFFQLFSDVSLSTSPPSSLGVSDKVHRISYPIPALNKTQLQTHLLQSQVHCLKAAA